MRQLRRPMVGRAELAPRFTGSGRHDVLECIVMAVIDVSRPVVPWSWRDVFLAPVGLLALAWGVPFLVLLALLPFGLVIAGAVRLGRMLLGS
jgi:hypothetical protein